MSAYTTTTAKATIQRQKGSLDLASLAYQGPSSSSAYPSPPYTEKTTVVPLPYPAIEHWTPSTSYEYPSAGPWATASAHAHSSRRPLRRIWEQIVPATFYVVCLLLLAVRIVHLVDWSVDWSVVGEWSRRAGEVGMKGLQSLGGLRWDVRQAKHVWDQLSEMRRDYFVQVRANPEWDPMVSVSLWLCLLYCEPRTGC
ncbi:hypothetical protein BKA70DRAFT_641387 [Coprinopsis sp. MPI-PUGE-AT-0042]|nr:hypothetical protein BKA70DRAFT_641387 [Coprinopsis sp. MPI-PUGE-AT-0042]